MSIVSEMDRKKEDLDPEDQGRGPCDQINKYLLYSGKIRELIRLGARHGGEIGEVPT